MTLLSLLVIREMREILEFATSQDHRILGGLHSVDVKWQKTRSGSPHHCQRKCLNMLQPAWYNYCNNNNWTSRHFQPSYQHYFTHLLVQYTLHQYSSSWFFDISRWTTGSMTVTFALLWELSLPFLCLHVKLLTNLFPNINWVSVLFIGCNMDIAVGFDITRRPSRPLFSGQLQLKQKLPKIISKIASLDNICCVPESIIKPKFAFSAEDEEFLEYSSGVAEKVASLTTDNNTFFNTQLLESFRKVFEKSTAEIKVGICIRSAWVHVRDLPYRTVSSDKNLYISSTSSPQKVAWTILYYISLFRVSGADHFFRWAWWASGETGEGSRPSKE